LNRLKAVILSFFIAGVIASLAGQALGYPPFLIRARKFGANDCTFCHVDPDGGPPFGPRGNWLIAEKERRKAETVDVEWLADYKPANAEGKKEESKQSVPADKPARMAGDNETVEKEITRMLEEIVDAAKRRDATVFNRLLADDFSETNADGLIITKAQVLAVIPDLKIDSYDFDEVNTRVLGTTAITTLRQKSKGSYKGQEMSGEYRETIVWVKRDKGWQMAAAHVSRVAR
jgi:hypothetical protein